MNNLPSGIRKVYNYFYKKKSLEGSFVPTPSQIREYFESQAFDIDNIVDEQFNQAVDYFSKGELATVNQDSDAITLKEKSEVVASTAENLGIVLNTQEISEIAANISYSSDDLHDSLDEIKSAIVAFIKYKAALNNQRISQVINDINQVASSEFSNNSQQLASGLQSINQQLQQQNTDFKSQVKSAIAAFAIPPAG
jgi:uncharacterized protein YukE